MSAPDATVIRTLRIKTAASDRLGARQQTERALQAAALRPIGLPRDAILIVRHLTARRAGQAGWEQAVNAELDQLARQAARPIEGAVPANANAVILADRSELLTCLAADWCAGVVRSQWWWQSLLRGDDVTRAVIDAWLAAPEYIPLALRRLAARQQAIVFAQHLSDEQTRALLHAVVQTFGLYELSLTLAEISTMEWTDREVMAASSTSAQVAPWHYWVQAHFERLSPDRQVLLGVGLMLPAAPSIVRSASFAAEVKAWHSAISTASQLSAPTETSPVSPSAPSSPMTVESIATSQVEETLDTLTMQPEEAISAEPALRGALLATKQSPPEQRNEPIAHEIAAPPSTAPQEYVVPRETAATSAIEQPSMEIDTEFGGVCYCINLGLFLNLYGDFTTPLRPGLDLPIWDFMALVAQDLIGDEVTRDPIWSLLTQLADRAEDEPPGLHFAPPGQVSLSVWLADLMSIIHPRLQLALGVNDDDLSRYFKQHARIVVNELNFDAYFALAELPIEIRLSGLDRDPGWVPVAGRTVRFHYD
jgi:hypothetical protein